MALRLTPDVCAAVYDCLREFRPFKGWRLPPGEEVQFSVIRNKQNFGFHAHYAGTDEHIIEVSELCNGHFSTLASTIAHEMIHMHQRRSKLTTKAMHNADFQRRAARVCREFGWDEKAF